MNNNFEILVSMIDDNIRQKNDVNINLHEDISTALPFGKVVGAPLGTMEQAITENNFVLPALISVIETPTATEGEPVTIWWHDHGNLIKMASLRVDEDWSLEAEDNIIDELRSDLNL